jgi:threonine/homoserine/homoserine lactone efflux protein
MAGPLTSGALAGLSIAVFVGFAAMSVFGSAARGGLRTGMAAGSGIATGDALWAAVTVTVGPAIGRVLAPWEPYLRWGAVAVLVVLGVFAIRQVLGKGGPAAELSDASAGAYCTYLAATLRDPVTVIFFGSLILGAVPRYGSVQAGVFVAGAFLGSLSWQSILAGVGARRGRSFSDRTRRQLWIIDCVLLALFVTYIALGWYR